MRAAFASTAFISGKLSPESRTRLDAGLIEILRHWTPIQRSQFIAAADTALAEYFALDKPLHDSEGPVLDILERAAEYARKAGDELSRLTESDLRFLAHHVRAACKLSSANEGDLVLRSPSQLGSGLID